MDGIDVRLSDGANWRLSLGDRLRHDHEFKALLSAAMEVEDRAEALQAELALTIFLLRRNYNLTPDQLASLLTFEPGDPALLELQKVMHEFLVELTAREAIPKTATATENQVPRQPDIVPGSI